MIKDFRRQGHLRVLRVEAVPLTLWRCRIVKEYGPPPCALGGADGQTLKMGICK